MSSINKYKNIESKIMMIRNQKVILDRDVAEIYGVETKRINEAVKNNPDRFPDGYIIEITKDELDSLRSKFSTLKNKGRGQHTKYSPKVFTEKGLYMLATILKSNAATQTTIAIIEAFARVRELTQTINKLSDNPEEEKQKSLMQKSGEIISELLDNDLKSSESETTIELNFAVLKFKHTITKK
ncbi:ORF6N domain-containing protein [Lentimicrobium sp. S6]|uniref:ORF6N domain-containing protein n=1 Tax=Lentimicrobium sp. S6 TaxID=2735872 RepID=UPI0015576ABA|nr:ORF6N domain-containing protein [Lentimicrobium sp. S6]NPD46754.1 ORF6N domain-containing protein [Lentimicrobium sp. S6]